MLCVVMYDVMIQWGKEEIVLLLATALPEKIAPSLRVGDLLRSACGIALAKREQDMMVGNDAKQRLHASFLVHLLLIHRGQVSRVSLRKSKPVTV